MINGRKKKPSHPAAYLGVVAEDPPPPDRVRWHLTLDGIRHYPGTWFKLRTYTASSVASDAATKLRKIAGIEFEIVNRRSAVYGRYLRP